MLDPQHMQVIVTNPDVFAPDGSMQQFTQGSELAAGYDLVAWPEGVVEVVPGEKATLVPLGIRLHIKHPNLVGMVYPRSGLGHKHGLTLGNTTGVIDADYQGEMFVSLYNRSDKTFYINPGDRIAQIVFQYVHHPKFEIVEEFGAFTARGEGGFGSTGVSLN